MDPKNLSNSLGHAVRPWVYISGPTINPTGLLYNDKEIQELLSVCAKHGARVVIDTSFSGLEFETSGWAGWNLEQTLTALKSSASSFSVSMLGGLSFELLAAGIDFGFLILNDSSLVDASYGFPSLSRPHCTSKYAVKKLLGLKNQADQQLSNVIAQHKKTLKNQANNLMKVLQSSGWDVHGCNGGISLVAKPTAYLGKSLKVDGFNGKLDGTNIREAILKATGLCINSASWTGIPDYSRFSFALESGDFEQALDRIAQFKKLVLGGEQ